MVIAVLFWILVLFTSGYAFILGGRDGKWAATLVVSASLLTIPATSIGRGWGSTQLAIFIVDLAMLIALYLLLLTSRRYWPIWMVGFQMITVAGHLTTFVVSDFAPPIYRALGSVWAIPMLLTMMLGVELDRKALRQPHK